MTVSVYDNDFDTILDTGKELSDSAPLLDEIFQPDMAEFQKKVAALQAEQNDFNEPGENGETELPDEYKFAGISDVLQKAFKGGLPQNLDFTGAAAADEQIEKDSDDPTSFLRMQKSISRSERELLGVRGNKLMLGIIPILAFGGWLVLMVTATTAPVPHEPKQLDQRQTAAYNGRVRQEHPPRPEPMRQTSQPQRPNGQGAHGQITVDSAVSAIYDARQSIQLVSAELANGNIPYEVLEALVAQAPKIPIAIQCLDTAENRRIVEIVKNSGITTRVQSTFSHPGSTVLTLKIDGSLFEVNR